MLPDSLQRLPGLHRISTAASPPQQTASAPGPEWEMTGKVPPPCCDSGQLLGESQMDQTYPT